MLGIFSPRFFRFPACVPWDWDAPAGATPSSSPCFPRDLPFHGIFPFIGQFLVLFRTFIRSFIRKLQLPNQGATEWDSPIYPGLPIPKNPLLGCKNPGKLRGKLIPSSPTLPDLGIHCWQYQIPKFPKIPADSGLLSTPFLLSLSHHSKPNPSFPLCSWELGAAFPFLWECETRSTLLKKLLALIPASGFFYPCFPELLLGALGISFTSGSVVGFRHSLLRERVCSQDSEHSR